MTSDLGRPDQPGLEQLWLDCRVARDRWQDALCEPAPFDDGRVEPGQAESFTIEQILGHSDARADELLSRYQSADALYRLSRADHYRESRSHDPLPGSREESK